MYEVRETAATVLEAHFNKLEPEGNPVYVLVNEAQLQRAIVALRVMSPNSLRSIEDMLPILYPGVAPRSERYSRLPRGLKPKQQNSTAEPTCRR